MLGAGFPAVCARACVACVRCLETVDDPLGLHVREFVHGSEGQADFFFVSKGAQGGEKRVQP